MVNIFELLYVSWKRERQSNILEGLNSDFFERVKPYLSHLESQYLNEKDKVVASLFKRRWSRAQYILNALITFRLEKHFKESLQGKSIPSELPFEEIEFRKNIDQIQNNFKQKTLNMDISDEVKFEEDTSIYKILQMRSDEKTVVVGDDFNKFGPFNENDFVIMPRQTARTYVVKSKANEIELDK